MSFLTINQNISDFKTCAFYLAMLIHLQYEIPRNSIKNDCPYHHHIASYIMHELCTAVILQTLHKGTGDQILLLDMSQT